MAFGRYEDPGGAFGDAVWGHGSYGGGYRGNFRRQNNFNANRQFKNSGCTMRTHTKTGEDKGVIISGFRFTQRYGRISFVAVPASKKYQTTENLKMVVTANIGFDKKTFWGTWNVRKGVMYVQDMNLIASPAKNAAWFYRKK